MTQSDGPGEGTLVGVRQTAVPGKEDDSPQESKRVSTASRRLSIWQRPRKHSVLRWSAATLAVVILSSVGIGYLYYERLNHNLQKGERSSGDSKATKAEPNAAGQTPLNILLIGSDSRNSDENVALGGSKENRGNPPLADVQMLIHLSANRKSAVLVSIPRDTRVDIPECTNPETGETYPATNTIINASLARGGAGCTLATWQNLTGVYIDHWMMIDFEGVVRMADAVGGVEVCVKHNVWDRPLPGVPGGSGLKMKAGTKQVTGKQALQWLRTRHAWGSDLLRARAQQMYMNSMIRTLRNQSVFTDTGRLMGLAEAATKSLTVSEGIGSVRKLYDLGMQLKAVPTDRITTMTMPSVKDPLNANHVIPDGANAEKLWKILRDDVPFDTADAGPSNNSQSKKTSSERQISKDPAATDDKIAIQVYNGTKSSSQTAVPQRAHEIAQLLIRKGFTSAVATSSALLMESKTVIRYPSADLQGDAERVADALGLPAASVKQTTDVSGVTLVVGADWRSGTAYPKRSEPRAGEVPENTNAINGSDTSQCMDVYAPYRW